MSNVPSTMRAIIADPPGGLEALQIKIVDVPMPSASEVLIKMTACGVNRPDTQQRQGLYNPPRGATPILGLEGAGEIIAVGNNTSRYRVGDKVCALFVGGSYAEYAVVPEGQCLPIPQGLPAGQELVHAAIIPECVFTVWANIFEIGRLKAGDIVMLHGGGSGIGSYAIQMIRAAGADVIVTVGSERKAEACKKIGATHTINYMQHDFRKEVERITNGKGVDIILDIIGADYLPRNLASLAIGGRCINIGTQHGMLAAFNLREMMMRNQTITGSTMRPRSIAEKSRIAREVEMHVWPWIASGKVKPQLFQSFTLEKVGEAHNLMESSAHIGKIALTM